MRKIILSGLTLLLTVFLPTAHGASLEQFSPGRRTLVLAHNAYPTEGQWNDRLDRAIKAGTSFAVEIDLVWGINPKTGKSESLVSHSAKSITGNEPTLKEQFFEHVRPIVEKALKENKSANWPLITLYLDIKNDPLEHLESISQQVGEYESWLTTTVKTDNSAKLSPLQVKPLMVLVEDKPNDIKQEVFYDRLPVGSNLHVFGSANLAMPPGKDLKNKRIAEFRLKLQPAELINEQATNYRRWFGTPWDLVESGAKNASGKWTQEKETKLKGLVAQAHKMGYLIGFYCLDGFEKGQGQGWDEEYNFGSLERAAVRWKAVIKAGADFISTDQYEEVSALIKGRN